MRPRARARIGALFALAALLLLPAAASAAVHPKRGDWEGKSPVGEASFLVQRVKIRHRHVDVIADFVAQDYVGCKGESLPTQGLYESKYLKRAVIRANGRVSARRKVRKPGYTVTEALKGRFSNGHATTLTFTQTTTGTAGRCAAREKVHAQPGSRPHIADGLWRGTSSTGEPLEFGVGFGGRVVTTVKGMPTAWAFQYGKWTCHNGSCTGTDNCDDTLGDMFIQPTGSFASPFNGEPDNPDMGASLDAPNQISGYWYEPYETDPSGNSCSAQWTAAPAG